MAVGRALFNSMLRTMASTTACTLQNILLSSHTSHNLGILCSEELSVPQPGLKLSGAH
jgi:hypothetical protein